ncbi:MAG: chemotaxis protein CheA [Candidatus Bathyarchaeota archaeon]|nr:chemotaxis protein CheA [Candidatus Bathyarchaeota archaeon]
MSLDMEQYKEEFIDEAREHIETLTQSLLTLEKDPTNTDALNDIFRSAHTLKGSSGMMGYKDLQDLAHAMEDIFDGLRKGGQVSSDLIDVLLECIDALTTRLESIQDGTDEKIETEQFVQRLHEISKQTKEAPKKGKAASKKKTSKKPEVSEFGEKENNQIKKALKSGNSCFLLKVKFTDDCGFKSLRANMVLENLSKKGKIVSTTPDKKGIEAEKIDEELKIVFVTKSDKNEVAECAKSVCEVDTVQVNSYDDDSSAEPKQVPQKESEPTKSKPTIDAKTAQTVRVHFEQLDELMNLTGELVINKIALLQMTSELKNDSLRRLTGNIDRLTADLQDLAMQIRMVPVSQVFDRFPRLVRDLSRKKGKKINMIVEGRDIEVDRTVLDEIGQPLIHIIRNSVDHGIEQPEERKTAGKNPTGTLKLVAKRKGEQVIIEVEDDGAGINPEKVKNSAIKKGFISEAEAAAMSNEQLTNLIFLPGMSTSKTITETSGRGVGMDVVKTKTVALGGSVNMETRVGMGTKLSLRLPPTLAIVTSLLVKDSNQTFAIPTSIVSEIVRVDCEQVKSLGSFRAIVVRGRVLPLLHLHSLLGLEDSGESEYLEVLVTHGSNENEKVGLVVDFVIGQQEIMIKPLAETMVNTKGYSGFTILGNGRVIPVLDLANYISRENQGKNQANR